MQFIFAKIIFKMGHKNLTRYTTEYGRKKPSTKTTPVKLSHFLNIDFINKL